MRRPRDLAAKLHAQRVHRILDDGFKRGTFTLPFDAARAKAREVLDTFPVGGYGTVVEHWRKLDDGRIEFTMKRLPTAD